LIDLSILERQLGVVEQGLPDAAEIKAKNVKGT
jgi:hypothetical protein